MGKIYLDARPLENPILGRLAGHSLVSFIDNNNNARIIEGNPRDNAAASEIVAGDNIPIEIMCGNVRPSNVTDSYLLASDLGDKLLNETRNFVRAEAQSFFNFIEYQVPLIDADLSTAVNSNFVARWIAQRVNKFLTKRNVSVNPIPTSPAWSKILPLFGYEARRIDMRIASNALLNDPETLNFIKENHVIAVSFDHQFRGNGQHMSFIPLFSEDSIECAARKYGYVMNVETTEIIAIVNRDGCVGRPKRPSRNNLTLLEFYGTINKKRVADVTWNAWLRAQIDRWGADTKIGLQGSHAKAHEGLGKQAITA